MKILTDYTLKHFYSELGEPSKESYIQLFRAISKRTLHMIMEWQRVGFVHGVMNTDNMSILGLTIDYGPYGWLEGFDFGWTPNTTDIQHKRYRYGNQPSIGLWNLYQLANALYPLIEDAKPLEEILEEYKSDYGKLSLEMMKTKIGLSQKDEKDPYLIQELENNLELIETDMTIFFRLLSNYKTNKDIDLILNPSIYNPEDLTQEVRNKWEAWFQKYQHRLEKEESSFEDRKKKWTIPIQNMFCEIIWLNWQLTTRIKEIMS